MGEAQDFRVRRRQCRQAVASGGDRHGEVGEDVGGTGQGGDGGLLLRGRAGVRRVGEDVGQGPADRARPQPVGLDGDVRRPSACRARAVASWSGVRGRVTTGRPWASAPAVSSAAPLPITALHSGSARA